MNQYAVITGATKGIGYAICEAMASQGIHLFINSRNIDDLEKMRSEFQIKYPDVKIEISRTDMSIKAEVIDFGKAVNEKLPWVDILVNNVAMYVSGEIVDEEDGLIEKMIDTNLYSAYHLTRCLLPKMIANKKGHIFNICSIASQTAYPKGGSYTISKFALLGFTKVLRQDVKDKGIKVTAILPGGTWSNTWEGVELPKSRLLQASDVAESLMSALRMSKSAVVEEIIVRPQLGDL